MLMYAAARLNARLPGAAVSPLLSALRPRLRRMSCRDVSLLVWSLAVLRVRPSAEFMAEAMAATKRQLSGVWQQLFLAYTLSLFLF